MSCIMLPVPRGIGMRHEKSAEGIVGRETSRRGKAPQTVKTGWSHEYPRPEP